MQVGSFLQQLQPATVDLLL